MTPRVERPSVVLSTLAVVLVLGVWAWVRLFAFGDSVVPLSYVIPLLLCVWTRRVWQLWLMALLFLLMTFYKAGWLLPVPSVTDREKAIYLLTTVANVVVGAIFTHVILLLRIRIEQREHELKGTQQELQEQAEELRQQNEEMSAQAEELTEQNGELESQREELERQNEELQEANERLQSREEVLHAAVECTRVAGGGRAALELVCQRTLSIVGPPAGALAVLELTGNKLEVRSQTTLAGQPDLPGHWPMAGSLGHVVVQKDQTAYVDDLQRRPDLSAPFDASGHYRSALATPIRMGGRAAGLLVVCSREPTHWTQEQFRLVEWAAAQVAPLLDSLRWQDALEQRAAAVEAANQAKDQFLAMLSHELRTPLTPVLAAAGALENDPRLPADVRAELAMMQRNVAVQSRLIDDLLDLTRIARGKLDLKPQVLSLVPLLREAAAIVAPEADAHEQTLDVQIELPETCAVAGDGARLQQVFWNLLKNAIKFSPRGSRIGLQATLRQGEPDEDGNRVETAVIRFTDQGVGIDADDLERIFRPFEQATVTRHNGGLGGLGLGLSIAQAIVQLHDGKLDAASAGAGHGAVFTVELPVVRLPAQSPATNDHNGVEAPGDNGAASRLLLVEDHGDTGRVMARLLRRSGFEVTYAETIASAWEAWQKGEFDLIVSDIGLPDGTGLELMKRIRNQRPDATGICMSGFGMDSDVAASREAGFAEHLIKPVDMQQLKAAIRRLAGSS